MPKKIDAKKQVRELVWVVSVISIFAVLAFYLFPPYTIFFLTVLVLYMLYKFIKLSPIVLAKEVKVSGTKVEMLLSEATMGEKVKKFIMRREVMFLLIVLIAIVVFAIYLSTMTFIEYLPYIFA